jgi:hypothetical protein
VSRAVPPLVAACLATFTLLAGCQPAPIPATPTVSLRMRGAPPNATVTIDDMLVGPLDVVQARGVGLPPGTHRISVEASGYLPWDKVVQATEGTGPVQLDVILVKIPD